MTLNYKYILIFIASVILFIPFLGSVHLFDWDEINFAECAREMIVSKDYLRMQIDFKPFYEKPPLFIWLQVLSMKVWGINEFAARFPNAIMGIITLISLFYIGKKVANEKIATYWVLFYIVSWLPHFYFKTGIIDPTFNLFIFLAFYQKYNLTHQTNKWRYVLFTGIFIGLAVLTKGPVAILISAISLLAFILLERGLRGFNVIHIISILSIALAVTSFWFGIEIINNGTSFLKEFINYQIGLFSENIADHQEPWYYHPIVLLIGCFPASIFILGYNLKKTPSNIQKFDFAKWMWILFWVVLILFSIVKTKIVHYSSLCYFPLSFLAAQQLYYYIENKKQISQFVRISFLIISILWSILLVALPLVGMYKDKVTPLIKDPFAVANLQAHVNWSYIEVFIGIIYFIVMIIVFLQIRKNIIKSIVILFISQIIMIQIVLLHFTPKIEAYSQRAAIDFYKSKVGQDVYVQVLGYRSYAHLFYTKKFKPNNQNYYSQDWLLQGNIDKPVFFVCKIQDADYYKSIAPLQEVYSKNGFVFFKRMP